MVTIPQIKMIAIETIKEANFQPQNRTEERKLKELLQSMNKYGFALYRPLLISKDGILADGHRRLACARKLGIKEVPVIFTNDALTVVFGQNHSIEPYRAGDWLQAYAQQLAIDDVPQPYRNKIAKLEAIVGQDGVLRLAMLGYSLGVLDWAKRIARYCDDDSDTFVNKTLWWLVENNMQFDARKAMEIDVDPEIFLQAIEENRSFRTGAVLS